MKKTINVTEANIRLGRETWSNGTKCVIFRALRRVFKSRVSYCGYSYFLLDKYHVPLPKVAKKMQDRLDSNSRAVIKPFSFTVNV